MNGVLTAARLKELLRYCPDTGVFDWISNNGMRVCIGKPVGSKSRGYLRIRVDGKKYFAHRLAWLYVHGEWPEHELDHVNRDRADNRIANLRPASDTQNQRNRGIQRNNSSGVTGVYWRPADRKWQAMIKINKKLISLGVFALKGDAVQARRAAEVEHFGSFAPENRQCP